MIQRLFATGLSLQGALGTFETNLPIARQRIEAAIDELDLTMKQIRTTIFSLEQRRGSGDNLRSQLLAVAGESAGPLGFEPRVLLDGPLDTGVEPRIGVELLATLREALANVSRHADASSVEVDVAAEAGEVVLRVVDNGVGPGDGRRTGGKGLANMAARAGALGGTVELRAGEICGTVLEWRVPKG